MEKRMKIILIPLLAAYIALALLIILQGIAQAQVYPGEDAGLSIRLDNRSNRIDNFGGYGGRGYGRDNYGGYRHHGYGFGLGNDVDDSAHATGA